MALPNQNRVDSVRTKMRVLFAFGICCLLLGAVMIFLHISPAIIPVLLISVGCSFVSVFLFFRNNMVRDEMVKRIDMLSGYYTCNATLYFLFACGIINYFIPFPLSVSWLLWTLMMFMSLTFIAFRYLLLRKGVPE